MDASDLITAYSKDPINNYEMEDFSVKMEQGNNVCGDMIVIYLKIKKSQELRAKSQEIKDTTSPKYIIEKYSYAGVPQMFTSAAASFLAEVIEGKDIETVLTWDYTFMKQHGFEVSPRRRRSMVTALLAVRNAIHEWEGDGVVDGYEEML